MSIFRKIVSRVKKWLEERSMRDEKMLPESSIPADNPQRPLFISYFVNLQKVIELRLILDNEIVEKRTRENSGQRTVGHKAAGSLKGSAMGVAEGQSTFEADSERTKSERLSEEYKVISNKSTYLSDILALCHKVESLEDAAPNSLVIVEPCTLSFVDEQSTRSWIVTLGGVLDDLNLDIGNGVMNVGKLMSSAIRGSGFRLRGTLRNCKDAAVYEEEFEIKVPLESGDLFENGYGIDDLLLGDSVVIGVYKGKIDTTKAAGMVEYFMHQKPKQAPIDIKESQSEVGATVNKEAQSSDCMSQYHYIDVIAIVQRINDGGSDQK